MTASMETMTFAEHKEQTARDLEQFAGMIKELAEKCREGDMYTFEMFWVIGGTEEGDAKILDLRERLILRYAFRAEKIE